MGHRDEVVATSNPPGVALGDKYDKAQGMALLSGSQALVRLLLNQAERDRAGGLNTGGFVSGYRGSPLSGFDQTLWSAGKQLSASGVHFQPAINEDLAATACWGTQQLVLFPGEATVEGVFAMWYGKGPGVDRSGDALKHGNGAGTSAKGGVLVLAGDDHTAKSSTFGHQSEQALVAAFIPVLYPSNVQEYLDLGVHGWAMSRHSGLWVGMKCVSDVVETTSVAEVSASRVQTIEPVRRADGENVHIRWPDVWAEQEPRIVRERLPAALAYCRANGLNRIVFKPPGARMGIVCAGKAYNDVRQALTLLGLEDSEKRHASGLALLKLGMVWPLEPEILREFAEGLDELLVVEEKRPLIEQQIKDELYADAVQGRLSVRVTGKTTGVTGGEWGAAAGQTLLRSDYELTPIEIAAAIARRLGLDLASDGLLALRLGMEAIASATRQPAPALRKPYFCSGCPHNSSTKVPEGSRAMAGIGCHYMANWMDRSTETYTHMGAEGVPWIAQSRFSTRRHIFANLGDGTYYHSGSLAIRQAVAAKVSMTYKILFNDAVAMTGGQPIEGELTVERIAQQVAAEGVGRIAIVSDDIVKYAEAGTVFPPGATVHHRDDLEAVQQSLADHVGVSVLIYDQTCASEKRRRRKRGTYPDPAVRVVINPAVCEGCGDCSVKSNCLSVEPLETELGRKRQINQSSCNKDLSCTEGFCPSFISVKGARLKSENKEAAGGASTLLKHIDSWGEPPAPVTASWDEVTNVLVNGVGGTGVVTVGALLGMAAHIEGRVGTVLDMAGLAQKGGAVWSHVRLAPHADALSSSRIPAGQADVLVGCDLVVSAHPDTLSRLQAGRSRGIVNSDAAPTAEFVRDGDWRMPNEALKAAIAAALPDSVAWLPAQSIAVSVFGDAIFANPVMLGYAWQMGWLPLTIESIRQAVRLNGQQVDRNLMALRVGRWAAHDRQRLEQAITPGAAVIRFMPQRKLRLEEVVAHRRQLLVAYQGERYASGYSAFMAGVITACVRAGGHADFAIEVASQLARLMAYKDEYEVARLHSDPTFLASIRAQFEGDLQLEYHLAPPLLAGRNERGELKKRRYGAWMRHVFPMLARLRVLRGTPLDPFGYTHERRMERRLPADYHRAVAAVLPFLADWPGECLELARLPARIRGYGHVKDRTIGPARERMQELVLQITGQAMDLSDTSTGSAYGKYLNHLWT